MSESPETPEELRTSLQRRAIMYVAAVALIVVAAYFSREAIYNAVFGPFEIHRLELVDAENLDDLGLRRWFVIRGDAIAHSGWQMVHWQEHMVTRARTDVEKPKNYYLVTIGRRTLAVESIAEKPSAELVGYLRPLPPKLRDLLDERATEEEKSFRLPYLLQEQDQERSSVFFQWGLAFVLCAVLIALSVRNLVRARRVILVAPSLQELALGGKPRRSPDTTRPRGPI